MEDGGQNFRWWFYYQALFSNSFDCFQIWKKRYVNRAKLTAQSVYTFYVNLIQQRNMDMNFSQSILYTTMQEVLLFLAPKDNKDFSHCSLIKNFPPISPHPLFGQQINVHSLALKKAETTRNTFVQVFFFHHCLLNNN